jgi:hypothetical protein
MLVALLQEMWGIWANNSTIFLLLIGARRSQIIPENVTAKNPNRATQDSSAWYYPCWQVMLHSLRGVGHMEQAWAELHVSATCVDLKFNMIIIICSNLVAETWVRQEKHKQFELEVIEGRCKWKDTTKMNFREIGCKEME